MMIRRLIVVFIIIMEKLLIIIMFGFIKEVIFDLLSLNDIVKKVKDVL